MSGQTEEAAAGRVLGVDVGSVRVGLALSDETRTLASPFVTLPRTGRDLWQRVAEEIARLDVRLVVIGLPRTLDGGEGQAADDARGFAGELAQRTKAPVEFWDERFTTALAERHLIAAGLRRRRRRLAIDAAAAALMLQSWLDARPARV